MSGEEGNTERGVLIKELADGVAALDERTALTIAELTAAGIVIWAVRRDQSGTPRCRFWPPVPWSALVAGGELSDQKLNQVIQARNGLRVLLLASLDDEPYVAQAFDQLRKAYPDALAFRCAARLDDMLRQVLTHDPLTQWYELVVLRRTPSGQLFLGGRQLFPPDARRGDIQHLSIRCEPGDEDGTAFAVVAFQQRRSFHLVSVQSAKLAPGSYDLTAELRQPGMVRFRGLPSNIHGLPSRLRDDHRSWSSLIAAVPARLPVPEPTHLICLVEISGADYEVQERLSRIQQLIETVAAGTASRLAVSLVSYGAHSFDRKIPDKPPEMLTWAGTSQVALSVLGRLFDHSIAAPAHPRAAQLECALTEVAGLITGQYGRPVVVTVGSRRAFPPRVDLRSEILPCPHRNDWRKALKQLRQFPNAAFGAIHDRGPDEEIWNELGSSSLVRLDAVDVPRFAVDLNLLSSTDHPVPFPLIEAGED